jgi:hypothetical protein
LIHFVFFPLIFLLYGISRVRFPSIFLLSGICRGRFTLIFLRSRKSRVCFASIFKNFGISKVRFASILKKMPRSKLRFALFQISLTLLNSTTQILASRALSLYCECLVNVTPARFIPETKPEGQQLSFTCTGIPQPPALQLTKIWLGGALQIPEGWRKREYLLYNLAPFQLSNQNSSHRSDCAFGFTRSDKYAMKKFGINGQWGNKLFLIVIHRFSLVKER